MKLNILGCYGPISGSDGPTSSYLMEVNDKKILMDMGAGSLINLQKICKMEDIDMVILSHLHADHINDLFILRYYLKLIDKKIPLYAPNSPISEFDRFKDEECFDVKVLEDNMEVKLDDIKISFLSTEHPVSAFMTKIEYNNKTFVYSGDSIVNDNLKTFIKGVDFALLDGAFISSQKLNRNTHMSSYEAAKTAVDMNVKKLMITHLAPFIDIKEYLFDAKKGSDEEILLAVPMLKVKI